MRIVEDASMLMQSGNKAQAHALFKQAIEMDPQNDHAWLGCAKTSGDLQAAFGFAKQALSINPQNTAAKDLYRILWVPEPTESSASAPRWLWLVPATLLMIAIVLLVLSRF